MTSVLMNIVLQLLEALVGFFFYEKISQLGTGKAKRLTVIIALYAVMTFFNLLFNYNHLINIALILVCHFIILYFFYKRKIIDSLYYDFLVILIMASTESISMNFISIVTGDNTLAFINNLTSYVVLIICSKSTMLLILLTVIFIFKKSDYEVTITVHAFVQLLLLFVSQFAVQVLSNKFDYSNVFLLYFSLVSTVLVIITLMMCSSVHQFSKREKEFAEFRMIKQREKIDQTYMSILEQNNKDVKVFTHDIKNHLEQISNLSDNPEIKEYVSKLYGTINQYSYAGISDNRMLDVIIRKYNTLCESKNISISFNVKNANLSFVDNTDLSTILNNLLDNAVEAAENSKGRKISVNIYSKSNSMQVLKISNSCDTPPEVKNKKLLTSKKNKELHGLGITSVSKTVKKYDGLFDWSYDDKNNIFEVTAIFSI